MEQTTTGGNEMNEKAISIMITEAIKTMARVHNCTGDEIAIGLMNGNEKLVSELTELVGYAEETIARA